MSPMTVFVRVLLKSSAICLGAALAIVQPSFDGGPSRRAVAQQSPVQAAIDGLVNALSDPDPGVRRNAAIALGDLHDTQISRQASVASRRSQSAVPVGSRQSAVAAPVGSRQADWRPRTADSDWPAAPKRLRWTREGGPTETGD